MALQIGPVVGNAAVRQKVSQALLAYLPRTSDPDALSLIARVRPAWGWLHGLRKATQSSIYRAMPCCCRQSGCAIPDLHSCQQVQSLSWHLHAPAVDDRHQKVGREALTPVMWLLLQIIGELLMPGAGEYEESSLLRAGESREHMRVVSEPGLAGITGHQVSPLTPLSGVPS